jgi:hypothetical protein
MRPALSPPRTIERLDAQAPPAPAVKTVRTNVLEIGYHEAGDASAFRSSSSTVSGRCACLRRRAAAPCASRIPRAGGLPARIRTDALSILRWRARRSRRRSARTSSISADAMKPLAVRGCGILIGDARVRRDRVGAPSGSRARGSARQRLSDSEHGDAGASWRPEAVRRLWYQWYFNTEAVAPVSNRTGAGCAN